jgi:hypothetical protein
MLRITLILSAILIAACSVLLGGQEAPPAEEPQKSDFVFVRLTFYPTASLSRYDYNNDLDLFEVRAYVELRRKSQEGDVVSDAQVAVLGQSLEFRDGQYEKRIIVDKDNLPDSVDIRIVGGGIPALEEEFPLPAWLILLEPRPSVIDPAGDLQIRWKFSRFSSPVDVQAYDFKKGDSIFKGNDIAGSGLSISADRIPPSTILRIFVIQSWLSKRFLGGDRVARGSEVIFIPWSQVFIRTKEKTEGTTR